MSDQQATGTSDPTYNVIAVVYHALQDGARALIAAAPGAAGP